jgi:SAM-dependent methyltransferase
MSESTALHVDPLNTDQLQAWDGDDGSYWAARAERFNEGVARYHAQFLAATQIGATEHVLDIGCGSGQTTRGAARLATEGSAFGVDLSSQMIGLARRLAETERIPNVTFEQADAQVQPFPDGQFDLAMSRSGAMFFGDPVAAFTNIARAVRPGGRLLLMAWQSGEQNPWGRSFFTALTGREFPKRPASGPGPYSLSEPDHVRELLTSAGFTDVSLRGVSEPMYFGRDPEDACEFIIGNRSGMLRDLDEDGRTRALDALRAELATHQTDQGILYDSAAWFIEARRG